MEGFDLLLTLAVCYRSLPTQHKVGVSIVINDGCNIRSRSYSSGIELLSARAFVPSSNLILDNYLNWDYRARMF